MIKINRITIKGFKKIKQTEIELSPNTNLLLGHNEEGKTSLEDAIIYALTDSIRERPKKDFVEAINNQCKTASVTITGQTKTGPFNIKRTLTKTNRFGPSSVQIGAQLGIDPHILLACLNANYYFDLPPNDQKKFIVQALGLKPALKDAFIILHGKGYAGNVCQEFWNEEIIKKIDHLGWDAGYNMVYDMRREAGQRIRALKEKQPELITEVVMEDKQISIDKIMETHKKIPLPEQEEKHKEELRRHYKELGGIQALSEVDKKKAEEQLEKCRTEQAELIEAEKWTKKDTAAAARLKTSKKDFDAKTKEDVSTLENLAESTQKLLAENKKLWKSDLKCPIPDKSSYAMCPAIEPDWFGQQGEIDDLGKRIRATKEKEFPEQKAWDTFSEKAATCKNNIARLEILQKDIQKLEEKLEIARPGMADRKKKLEMSIAKLEKKVEHLKVAQSAITWNQATQKMLDTMQARIDEAEAMREHYDGLYKLLSPDGIPKKLVLEKLEALNARLAEHAEMIGVKIHFLDDLSLVQGDKKQLWVLGGAETSRARMAVAEAISHVTGVGLLLLDECNINVAADSTRVRKWIVDIGKTTQIVAAAATHALGPPAVSKDTPVRIFWVEDGKIARH